MSLKSWASLFIRHGFIFSALVDREVLWRWPFTCSKCSDQVPRRGCVQPRWSEALEWPARRHQDCRDWWFFFFFLKQDLRVYFQSFNDLFCTPLFVLALALALKSIVTGFLGSFFIWSVIMPVLYYATSLSGVSLFFVCFFLWVVLLVRVWQEGIIF